ncbi:MAG: DsrE family protein [Acholeplasmataceae bacterium]|nr:DsrE family protein [Acholeplasmataceae bacterium]
MTYLLIVNESPYGNEKPYNALRMAMTLQTEHNADIHMFFMGDSVVCALRNQKTPDGYYNLERMIKAIIRKKGAIYLCGTCMDARGINEVSIIENSKRSTMSELCVLTEKADKVLVF